MPDDLFMVTNAKHPDYGNVYQCAGIGPENLIVSRDSVESFHFLNITKVIPHQCTNCVRKGDAVCSYFAVRHARGIINNLFFGRVKADSDSNNWCIQIGRNQEVEVPKIYTYRIIKPLKWNEHGIRGPITPGIPQCRI